jgi:hypothetical protein
MCIVDAVVVAKVRLTAYFEDGKSPVNMANFDFTLLTAFDKPAQCFSHRV